MLSCAGMLHVPASEHYCLERYLTLLPSCCNLPFFTCMPFLHDIIFRIRDNSYDSNPTPCIMRFSSSPCSSYPAQAELPACGQSTSTTVQHLPLKVSLLSPVPQSVIGQHWSGRYPPSLSAISPLYYSPSSSSSPSVDDFVWKPSTIATHVPWRW